MPFWHVFVTCSLETVLPYKQISDVTIFQVTGMCVLILPADNWYPAINGNKAVEFFLYFKLISTSL